MALSFSCNPWGSYGNPGDPKAANYQGYPTVKSSGEIQGVSPANGGTLIGAILTISKVDGATGYELAVATSPSALDSSPAWDFATNVIDLGTAPSSLSDATTYFWKARAKDSSGQWSAGWSPVAHFTTNFSIPTATPTLNPPGGLYSSDQSVTLTSATTHASIYYTIDGTTPTTSSAKYTGAIAVAGDGTSTTIKAIAKAAGNAISAVTSASYTIAYPSTAAPTFNPAAGMYTSSQSVTITCATPSSTIFYTIDGSDPATSPTRLSGPSPVGPFTATVNPATTIRAVASVPAHKQSTEASAVFRMPYAIGDSGPAGGIVFYDKGSYSSGWRFLEAAPSNQSSGILWDSGTYIMTSATDTAIGTGASNTSKIIAAEGSGSYAAKLCDDLVLGGYSDWFLPSKDELKLMYTNLQQQSLGGFAQGNYWSSSQDTLYYPWSCSFYDGSMSNGWRSADAFNVRAVRSF